MSVLFPTSLDEALSMLDGEEAIPVAGGTDLLVHWPSRLDLHAKTFLDLSQLDLAESVWDEAQLTLGALTTYWDIVRDERAAQQCRLLTDAARTVGAIQIQARGTWAGNIVNASPAADGVPALMAYDASVVLASTAGTERVPLDDFYTGYKSMRRRANQLVVAIQVPLRACRFESFVKVGSRRAQAITKIGFAVTWMDDGWRVVANSMAPTVTRCRAVEKLLNDETPIDSPADLEAAVDADVSPIDDIRSTAAYRREVFCRALYHELAPACHWIGDR